MEATKFCSILAFSRFSSCIRLTDPAWLGHVLSTVCWLKAFYLALQSHAGKQIKFKITNILFLLLGNRVRTSKVRQSEVFKNYLNAL